MQRSFQTLTLVTIAVLLFIPRTARAQARESYPGPVTPQTSQPAPPSPAPTLSPSNPFAGSVPEGKVTSEALPLSFEEALTRGLRNNLGLLLQDDNLLTARGQKWKELSSLLPNLTTSTSENLSQINLSAMGIRIPGINPIIGPFGWKLGPQLTISSGFNCARSTIP